MVLGHVDNPLKSEDAAAQIARLKTIIHEHELGIRKPVRRGWTVEEQKKANRRHKRVLTGQVVSDKMDKTIVVAISGGSSTGCTRSTSP